jgi:hypothetical protein
VARALEISACDGFDRRQDVGEALEDAGDLMVVVVARAKGAGAANGGDAAGRGLTRSR